MDINPQFVIDSLIDKVNKLTQELILKDAQLRQVVAEQAAAVEASKE